MKYAVLVPDGLKSACESALGNQCIEMSDGSSTLWFVDCATDRAGIERVMEFAGNNPTAQVWLDGRNTVYIQSKIGGNVKAWPAVGILKSLNHQGINRGTG